MRRLVKKTAPSSDLKRYLDAGKKPTVVLGAVEQHLLTRPPDTSRRTDVLHPSEVSGDKWCVLAAYHELRGGTPQRDAIGLRLASIFAEGHAIHDKWQGWFANMGVLYGTWGDEKEWGHGPGRYREVPIDIPDLRVQGHADGWLTLGSGDYLLEIKSVGTGTIRTYAPELLTGSLAKSFSGISRPFGAHLRQASIYAYGLHDMAARGLLDREPPAKILFLYQCKEDQAAKEFVVEYSPEIIAPAIERMRAVVTAAEAGDPPVCSLPNCTHKGFA